MTFNSIKKKELFLLVLLPMMTAKLRRRYALLQNFKSKQYHFDPVYRQLIIGYCSATTQTGRLVKRKPIRTLLEYKDSDLSLKIAVALKNKNNRSITEQKKEKKNTKACTFADLSGNFAIC